MNLYNIYIYEQYKVIQKANNLSNLWKIFEWYTCIKLYEIYNRPFYEYNDIDPNYKEINSMSRNDTGIDACDMIDSIVQCKLRKNKLSLSECATFFASQNIFCSKENKTIIKWNNLIIARNKESKLSSNLSNKFKLNMFIDIQFSIDDIILYCENLLLNPPIYPIMDTTFLLRDYQYEAIDNINNNNNKNVIISLPTGCGKNIIIIYSLNINKKYLILVPRIILMEQFKYEIIKHKPEYKHNINCIKDHITCYK